MKFNLTIETKSPLHIGTGTELLKDFDYVSSLDKTYVINQDVVYGAEFDQRGGEARLSLPPAHLVSQDQWREGSPLVRYTLLGSTTIDRIHEQIKDVYGQCYLPGSSLKGALRTGLLASATLSGSLSEAQVNVRQNNRGEYVKEEAAKNFERMFFRPAKDDPNHDLLRSLHVFDSQPLPTQPSKLVLCPVRVFTGGEPGSPIVVEAVQTGAVFVSEITIDELTLQYAGELGWEEGSLWLVNLVRMLQEVSCIRIQHEMHNARDKGFLNAESFYQDLDQLARSFTGTNRAILQLGWGTGWNGMTIGAWLPKRVQNEARQKFQLGRPPGTHGFWEPDLSKPFPKSRRLRAANESSGVPLGWVAITFEPVGKPGQLWQDLTRQANAQPIPTLTAPARTAPAEASASRLEAQRPAIPWPEPPAREAVVKRPLIERFTQLPNPADRFTGTVWFIDDDGSLYIEIPGLSADDYAAAVVKDPPAYKKFKEEEEVVCQVLRVEKDPHQPGHWLVVCELD